MEPLFRIEAVDEQRQKLVGTISMAPLPGLSPVLWTLMLLAISAVGILVLYKIERPMEIQGVVTNTERLVVLSSPIDGVVIRNLARPSQLIERGQPLITLSAKTVNTDNHELKSTFEKGRARRTGDGTEPQLRRSPPFPRADGEPQGRELANMQLRLAYLEVQSREHEALLDSIRRENSLLKHQSPDFRAAEIPRTNCQTTETQSLTELKLCAPIDGNLVDFLGSDGTRVTKNQYLGWISRPQGRVDLELHLLGRDTLLFLLPNIDIEVSVRKAFGTAETLKARVRNIEIVPFLDPPVLERIESNSRSNRTSTLAKVELELADSPPPRLNAGEPVLLRVMRPQQSLYAWLRQKMNTRPVGR